MWDLNSNNAYNPGLPGTRAAGAICGKVDTMDKLTRFRSILNALSLIIVIVTITGVLDGLFSTFRKPETLIHMVQGDTRDVVGRFYGNTQAVSDLGFESSSRDLELTFEPEGFNGFWLGEGMWRATLYARPGMEQGGQTLKITYSDLSNLKEGDRRKVEDLSTFRIQVYPDALSLRRHDASWVMRTLGVSPWLLSMVFFIGLIVLGAVSFVVSCRVDDYLALEGKAEIYRVKPEANGLDIFFGLGEKHGLSKGERMMLFSDKGKGITTFNIDTPGEENTCARIGLHNLVRPGFIVARIRG